MPNPDLVLKKFELEETAQGFCWNLIQIHGSDGLHFNTLVTAECTFLTEVQPTSFSASYGPTTIQWVLQTVDSKLGPLVVQMSRSD